MDFELKRNQRAGGFCPSARAYLLGGCFAVAMALMPAAAIAQPMAPNIAAEIKSEARSDRDLRAFYAARNYRPLWIRGSAPGPEADRLIQLVAAAELDGLDPDDYRPRRLVEAVEDAHGGSRKALAKAETMLSETFADYVRDLRRPRDVGMVYLDSELKPAPPSTLSLLQAAAAAPSLARHLESLGGMNPFYAELRHGLAERREGWSELPQIEVPEGPLLKPGATGFRVEMLRARLGLDEDGAFDARVATAVRAFQSANGLPVDGAVGPRTLAVLNRDPAQQDRLIRLNMERARALPASAKGRHIVVDAASARMWLYENGRVEDTMRVIVGKPEQPTPMLAGMMRYAILNPYWNVPHDLTRDRIAPEVLKKGVRYLKGERYEVMSDWTEKAEIVDPKTVDWAAVAAGRKELRIRQLPGKANSMGKVKFMMPNDLGIYLHDTPDKHLFADAGRRFSSGCVRLEDAARLGRWLFGKPLVAPSEAPEQLVNLPEPVPVYITYLTASPTEQGIAFREDAYGRDSGRGGARYAAGTTR